jgi:hypothetical protein
MLSKEVRNIEYIDGSNLTHSSEDEEGSNGLLAKKTMIRNDPVDHDSKKLKYCSKVKLSTIGGFQKLDVPNCFSLGQIQVGMDEVQKKKGQRNA